MDGSLKYTQEPFMIPTIQWEFHWLRQMRLSLSWMCLKIICRREQIDTAHLNTVFQEAFQVPEGQSFTEEYLPENYYCKNLP